MVKQNIIISGYQDSEDKSRTSFETNKGKMSAFKNEGSTLIADLKSHAERLISVEIMPSKTLKTNGEPYMNIRGFNGLADPNSEEQPKTPVKKEPEQALPVLNSSNDKFTTMYVSYAKDLMVAGKTIDESIAIIKQLQEVFS